MSVERLKAFRHATGLSQAAFALEIGLPLRTYENLESGRSPVRAVHINAAKWALFARVLRGNNVDADRLPEDLVKIFNQIERSGR